MRLRNVIASRLSRLPRQVRKYQHSDNAYERFPAKNTDESRGVLYDEAAQILDRVKVMRVFDFAGVVEAVAEVGHSWEESRNVAEGEALQQYSKSEYEIPSSQEVDNEDSNDDIVEVGNTARMGGVGMIVIDNFANPVNSMMAKSQVQGITSVKASDIEK